MRVILLPCSHRISSASISSSRSHAKGGTRPAAITTVPCCTSLLPSQVKYFINNPHILWDYPQDLKKAVNVLERACEQGSPESCYFVGGDEQPTCLVVWLGNRASYQAGQPKQRSSQSVEVLQVLLWEQARSLLLQRRRDDEQRRHRSPGRQRGILGVQAEDWGAGEELRRENRGH